MLRLTSLHAALTSGDKLRRRHNGGSEPSTALALVPAGQVSTSQNSFVLPCFGAQGCAKDCLSGGSTCFWKESPSPRFVACFKGISHRKCQACNFLSVSDCPAYARLEGLDLSVGYIIRQLVDNTIDKLEQPTGTGNTSRRQRLFFKNTKQKKLQQLCEVLHVALLLVEDARQSAWPYVDPMALVAEQLITFQKMLDFKDGTLKGQPNIDGNFPFLSLFSYEQKSWFENPWKDLPGASPTLVEGANGKWTATSAGAFEVLKFSRLTNSRFSKRGTEMWHWVLV